MEGNSKGPVEPLGAWLNLAASGSLSLRPLSLQCPAWRTCGAAGGLRNKPAPGAWRGVPLGGGATAPPRARPAHAGAGGSSKSPMTTSQL